MQPLESIIGACNAVSRLAGDRNGPVVTADDAASMCRWLRWNDANGAYPNPDDCSLDDARAYLMGAWADADDDVTDWQIKAVLFDTMQQVLAEEFAELPADVELTLDWVDETPEVCTWGAFKADNAEDQDLLVRIANLEPGASYTFGGGAAPACTITRGRS